MYLVYPNEVVNQKNGVLKFGSNHHLKNFKYKYLFYTHYVKICGSLFYS